LFTSSEGRSDKLVEAAPPSRFSERVERRREPLEGERKKLKKVDDVEQSKRKAATLVERG